MSAADCQTPIADRRPLIEYFRLEIMTNENSRPLVRPEAMPSVRLRPCQESDLGMVECPLSATPLREASQGYVKTARTDSVQAIVRPLIANRLPPTAESEILTKQPPFFHSPTRAIPRSVTEHTTVRHCGHHGPSLWVPRSVTVGITVTDRGVPPQEHVRGGGAGLSEPECGTAPHRLRDSSGRNRFRKRKICRAGLQKKAGYMI